MTKHSNKSDTYWMSVVFVAAQIAFCYLIGAGDRGRIIAGCILGLTLAATTLKYHFHLSKSLHSLLLICSGCLFASVAVSKFFSDAGAGLLELFELLAEFLLVVQALELMRGRSSDLSHYWMNNYLPGLGTIAFVLLLVLREIPFSYATLNRYFLGVAILLFMVMRPDFFRLLLGGQLQRRKAITLGSIIFLSLVTGTLFRGEVVRQLPLLQELIRRQQPDLDDPRRRATTTRAQFVDRVDLGSITAAQLENPNELVFRAESAAPPGYMRTLTFEQFDGKSWFNTWTIDRSAARFSARRIAPLASIPSSVELSDKPEELDLFPLSDTQADRLDAIQVSVPLNHGRLVPLPLTANYILGEPGGRARQLVIDAHGNIWPNSLSNREYRVYAGKQMNWPNDEDYLRGLLQVPAENSDFIRQFATNIFREKNSIRDKIRGVEQFFASNFAYSLESDAIGELRGRSPLQAFLENGEGGHCEYFATATVLLLRSQGVPSRLSSGYLVYEMNDDLEYYYARNRDAHAWAEAYDRERGKWVLVESTPGIRAITARFDPEQASSQLAADQAATTEGNLFSSNLWNLWLTLQAGMNRITSMRFAWLIPVFLASVLLAARSLRRLRRDAQAQRIVSRVVRQADKKAARLGFHRAHHETCAQFAQRLAAAPARELHELGDWYKQYSEQRYQSN